MTKTKLSSLIAALALVLVAPGLFAAGVEERAAPSSGAWVDEVVFREQATAAAGVSMLQAGDIDVFAFPIADAQIYRRIVEDRNLGYERSFGSYDEITFNPVGPVFPGTGKLNPFAVSRVREAMNYLIDRSYIAEEIYGGLANPRYTAVNTSVPDYTRLIEVNRKIEILYSYDMARAEEMISEEMEKLGARKVGGTWQYEGEDVELIFIIRTEDARREIGDYVANQLEQIGFKVDRQYKTGAEASPLWISGDPGRGVMHLYTGGWVTTAISRDLAGNFDFFYTPRGLSFALWQAYRPSPGFDAISSRLYDRDFTTMEQRADMFAEALELSMKDSVRVWLTDRIGVAPRRANVAVAADLSGSISGTFLWAHTIRFTDAMGGTVRIAMPSMLPEPWNPIAGSNWIYDMMIIRATQDVAVIPDPYTGLALPQRIERAEVTLEQGLPVDKTHDWVSLDFAQTINVPSDAWIGWDADQQRFTTVGQEHPNGLTAKRKSVVYFEEDLLTKEWHDGSPLSLGDMVMSLILAFDRGDPESPYFDEAYVPQYEAFVRNFRGAKIVQRDPVVIEYYADNFFPDAENNVSTLWPNYAQGNGAWHQLAVALRAEGTGQLALSKAKADKLEVEWTNMIAGPSIDILKRHLSQARAENFIPYGNALGQFVSASEVRSRWQNLQSWVDQKNHFWVGLGPFYLERAFPVEKSAQIRRFENYADPNTKWARFDAPRIAEVDVRGPTRVASGSSATFEVGVSFAGEPYRIQDMESVKYLLFNAAGELVTVGDATAVRDGDWKIDLTAAETGRLAAGSNRLEIAVVPKIVSIPSFDSLQFATTR